MHSLSSLDSIWGPSYKKNLSKIGKLLKKGDPPHGFPNINRNLFKGATRGNRGSAGRAEPFSRLITLQCSCCSHCKSEGSHTSKR